MRLSKDHPRYRSLFVREKVAALAQQGIVSTTGLIAHGRGEAFDYLIGERTTSEADMAEKAAAAALLRARRPAITINGNAAALAAKELVLLAQAVGAKVEINLFHRSEERMVKVCAYVEGEGGLRVLGRNPDTILEGIASDRAQCCMEGLGTADVVLIPLEDGDRAEAMVRAGKTVIAIDLNPLSRTSKAAQISIVDELTRAVPSISRYVDELKGKEKVAEQVLKDFDNQRNLESMLDRIIDHLRNEALR